MRYTRSDMRLARFQVSLTELLFFTALAALALYALLGREFWHRQFVLPGILNNPEMAISDDDSKVINYQPGVSAAVYATATGEQLLLVNGDISAVALSRDGARAVVATHTGEVELWNVADKTKLLTLAAHSANVTSVAFSKDGKRLITAGADTLARVWDAKSGKQLAVLAGHTGLVHRAYLSDDGLSALTISTSGWGVNVPAGSNNTIWGDKTDRLWDIATGRELKRGTAWFEETGRGSVSHPALAKEDYVPYRRDYMTTSDRGQYLNRPSYGSPIELVDAHSHETLFAFDGCSGREVQMMFSNRENLVIAGVKDTQIWRRVVSSKYNRVARWWALRAIPIVIVLYVAWRVRKRRVALTQKTAAS